MTHREAHPGPRWLTAYLRGGIGNQLLQFAHARELSLLTGRNVRLSTALMPEYPDSFRGISRWPYSLGQLGNLGVVLDSQFHQPPNRTSLISRAISVLERLAEASPDKFRRLGLVTAETIRDLGEIPNPHVRCLSQVLDGPAAIRTAPFLREKFANLEKASAEYVQLQEAISRLRPNVIHVRSGDFEELTGLYGSLGPDYWLRASLNFDRDRPLVVFTDAKNPVEKLAALGLSSNWVVGPTSKLSPAETLSLMSGGSSFSGSNSTFSWWAALLGSPQRSVTLPLLDVPNSIRALGQSTSTWRWLEA